MQISQFLYKGLTVTCRSKLSFSSKKVTNITILKPGLWLTKVENDYFNIRINFPDDNCRTYCTNLRLIIFLG